MPSAGRSSQSAWPCPSARWCSSYLRNRFSRPARLPLPACACVSPRADHRSGYERQHRNDHRVRDSSVCEGEPECREEKSEHHEPKPRKRRKLLILIRFVRRVGSPQADVLPAADGYFNQNRLSRVRCAAKMNRLSGGNVNADRRRPRPVDRDLYRMCSSRHRQVEGLRGPYRPDHMRVDHDRVGTQPVPPTSRLSHQADRAHGGRYRRRRHHQSLSPLGDIPEHSVMRASPPLAQGSRGSQWTSSIVYAICPAQRLGSKRATPSATTHAGFSSPAAS
jgi:hypothetical protein